MSNLFENPRRELFSLTDDWTFHYAFGQDTEQSRRALIAILNDILNRKEDPIKSISILNPVIYRVKEDKKESVLDIKAITNSNELIDIELQSSNFRFYADRSLFYGGRLIYSALEKGENYDRLKKSIVISFVDGIMFSQTEKIHTVFRLKEEDDNFLMSDKVEFHFIELGKINDIVLQRELDDTEQLAAYLKYANDKNHEKYLIELLSEGSETITMVEKIFKELTEDDLAYEMNERRIKYEHHIATVNMILEQEAREKGLAEGREKGLAEGHREGHAEGLEEGRREACRENASKMKSLGLDEDTICKCTGLTKEEIKQL